MNQTLTSIFETQGPQSLDISKKNFSNDYIFEEFIDSCFFHQVNLFNCSFKGSELLGATFISCSFENCNFNDTIIRKSEFTDCKFKNCQFIGCQLTPKTNFFQTLFMNCQFSTVDFSSTLFFKCEFIEINLTKVKFQGTFIVELKTKSIIFNDLQFNEANLMKIFKSKEAFSLKESVKITNSLSFQKEIEINS
jgi:uncharacterized protein YjbI with pentapeptide repeats